MKEGKMQHLKMSAFVINEDSYSLAVAILPAVFATIPYSEVVGHYVVVNQPNVHFSHNNVVQTLVLESSWMSKEDFYEMYKPVGSLNSTLLSEVVLI